MGSSIYFSAWLTLQLAVGTGDAVHSAKDLPSIPTVDESLEVLTRGPVHEAFAEQVPTDPVAGIVVPKQPPAPVDEIPPEFKPEGEDVIWIPGYWFWDDEREDFLWVSGVWRNPPPGRRWVPGYWQSTGGDYQWVSGFWAADTVEAFEYQAPPPSNLEMGPSSPAPSDDHFWIPGRWVYRTNRYRWRPGSWCLQQTSWTWVCGRYVWTPRGCLYIDGYWDYPLTRRGCLFAPVYFRSSVYLHAGYRYRPACWVGYESLLLNLFIRPRCHHYYFGDYYAPVYRRQYQACYSYFTRHRGYDPLYTYYSHYYRSRGIDYVDRVRQWHHYYADHRDSRPAHTWSAQRHRPLNSVHQAIKSHERLGHDLRSVATADRAAWHATKLDIARLRGEQFQHLASLRHQLETARPASDIGSQRSVRHARKTAARLVLPTAKPVRSNNTARASAVVTRNNHLPRQLTEPVQHGAAKRGDETSFSSGQHRSKRKAGHPMAPLPAGAKPAPAKSSPSAVPRLKIDGNGSHSAVARAARAELQRRTDAVRARAVPSVVSGLKSHQSSRPRPNASISANQGPPKPNPIAPLRFKTGRNGSPPTAKRTTRLDTRQYVDALRARAAKAAQAANRGHRPRGPSNIGPHPRATSSRDIRVTRPAPAETARAAAVRAIRTRQTRHPAHINSRSTTTSPATTPPAVRHTSSQDMPSHTNAARTRPRPTARALRSSASSHGPTNRAARTPHGNGEPSASRHHH